MQISNSIHTKIKFTLEKPVDNTIPFLDLSIGKIHNSFQYSMYVKDSHSNTCLPFNSFVPNSRKINLIYSETRRAIYRSSNAVEREKSLNIIKQRFLANGYPKNFIEKHKFVEKTFLLLRLKKLLTITSRYHTTVKHKSTASNA